MGRQVPLLSLLLLLGTLAPAFLGAQSAGPRHVVFQVKTPFDMGGAIPDSGRVNDYYVRIGLEDGTQAGTVLNVYREKEVGPDDGSFKFRTKIFIGRLKVVEAQDKVSVARVVDLASYGDPHRNRNAVMKDDFVAPVFVVQSENLFDKGSSTLRPEAIRELDRGVSFIKRFRPIKVRVEGHTDSTGDEDINMSLSQQRASSVRDYLVSQGRIDTNILIPVGYGESRPVASNDTLEGQRKNRRFEIVIEQ